MEQHLRHTAVQSDPVLARLLAGREQCDFLRAQAGGPGDAEPALRQRRLEHVGAADEIGDEARARPLVNCLGVADLLDSALVEHGDAVGHRQRLALVVRHEGEGDAERALQRLELALHGLAQF